MKIIKADRVGTKVPKTITFVVDDPLTFRPAYKVVLDRNECQEAIEYLRTYNGSAPALVHALIDGMEIALQLRVRSDA